MPPWKEEELHSCLKKVYPKCTEEDFQPLFQKWGGSIRFLLTSPSLEYARDQLLEEFLQDTCLINIVNMRRGHSGVLASEMEILSFQWLVHMIPIEDEHGSTNYQKITLSLPSHYVASQVAEMIRNNDLKFDWKNVEYSRLLGSAYESHVLNSLFKVSSVEAHFPVSAQIVSDEKLVSIPAVKEHSILLSKHVIQNPKNGTLYIESNSPGLNLVLPPWIFQIVTSKEHNNNNMVNNMEKMTSQFPSVKQWEACFIIPSAICDKFNTLSVSHPLIKNTYKLAYDF